MALLFVLAAAGTQTVAVKQADDSYRLYGYKWFSSATDSDMALTLARPSLSKNGEAAQVDAFNHISRMGTHLFRVTHKSFGPVEGPTCRSVEGPACRPCRPVEGSTGLHTSIK